MPSTQKQWTVAELNGFDGLKLATDAPVPQVGENDVLVKCKFLDLIDVLYPRKLSGTNDDN
jgi:hypothetical protein